MPPKRRAVAASAWLNSSDMNGLALEYDPAGDRTAIRPERMPFHVLLLLTPTRMPANEIV